MFLKNLVFGFVISVAFTCVQPDANAAKHQAKKSAGPQKQIFEYNLAPETSRCLGATGVAAYVMSSVGTNRGLLLKDVQGGFAANIGMQAGDVLLNINNHVIQTGRDADRVLESGPAGPGRVTFVHPGDSGLQLYNLAVKLPHFEGSTDFGSNDSGASSSSNINSTTPKTAKDISAYDAKAIPACERFMVELVNSDRQKNGSGPISWDDTLANMARSHAQDMATRGFFAHVTPDGRDPMDRAHSFGLKGTWENLSFQSGMQEMRQQVQTMENQMMSEPPNQKNHRGNILDPQHRLVGIGIARAKDGRVFAVQEFMH